MNADAIKKQIGDLTYFDAEAGAGNE
jgi:hypothetical protein